MMKHEDKLFENSKSIQELKKAIEEAKNQQDWTNGSITKKNFDYYYRPHTPYIYPCPNCGYCPHCGRGRDYYGYPNIKC